MRYTLRLPPGTEDTARRVHDVYHAGCPVYRSISGCIRIDTEIELQALDESAR